MHVCTHACVSQRWLQTREEHALCVPRFSFQLLNKKPSSVDSKCCFPELNQLSSLPAAWSWACVGIILCVWFQTESQWLQPVVADLVAMAIHISLPPCLLTPALPPAAGSAPGQQHPAPAWIWARCPVLCLGTEASKQGRKAVVMDRGWAVKEIPFHMVCSEIMSQ